MRAEEVLVHTADRNGPRAVHRIVLVLDRLRSAYNVGNIFRLAEIGGVERVVTCGYTATPPHPKLRKTARECDRLVPFTHFERSIEAVRLLKADGYQIVGVETVEGALDVWEVPFRPPVALVFGNESLGISRETLAACDLFARLPVFGRKNSLNVSNTAAVALYSVIRQIGVQPQGAT